MTTRPTAPVASAAPVAVGLVGAGPWAQLVHAPVLAAGPETVLAGVWARRPEAAAELAAAHGARTAASFEELLDLCEAVAFCVPPDVQVDLAVRAAGAGKALLLEKPLAGDLDGARRITDAVGSAGVGSLLVLTSRFSPTVRRFLAAAATRVYSGARACMLTSAFLEGPFSNSQWRHERGALLDIGPHVIDLLDAALGNVVEVRANIAPSGWTTVDLMHATGVRSHATLCCSYSGPGRSDIELFGPDEAVLSDLSSAVGAETFATLRAEFAEVARTGRSHPCDAHRGLHLQELLARAESSAR